MTKHVSVAEFSAWILSLYVPLSLKGHLPHQKSLFVPYRTQKCPFPKNFKEILVPGPQNLSQNHFGDVEFSQNFKQLSFLLLTLYIKHVLDHISVIILEEIFKNTIIRNS